MSENAARRYLLRRADLRAPGPTVEGLSMDCYHRVVVSWQKRATLVEFEDVLFRTDSAVVLPNGDRPVPGAPDKIRSAASIAATVLRRAEEYGGEKLLVIGHADTKGAASHNLPLSRYRADAVRCVLLGDAERFAQICATWTRMGVADYQQILAWLASTRDWDCDPGPIDGDHGPKTQAALTNFRRLYNEEGPGSSWAAPTPLWGEATQPATWKAYFNCYEEALAEELGETREAVSGLRANLKFFTPDQLLGCGESHPKEAENFDEYASQTNRRVEVLFIDPEEPARLDCHPDAESCDPGRCELYDNAKFRRWIVPPLVSALPWRATWDRPEEPAKDEDQRPMRLTAPGLPEQQTGVLRVFQRVDGGTERLVTARDVVSGVDSVESVFEEWFDHERVEQKSDSLPVVTFEFEVEIGGRKIRSRPLVYADSVDAQYHYEHQESFYMRRIPYVVWTHWGTVSGETNDLGEVTVGGLPPGGAFVRFQHATRIAGLEYP